MRIVSWNLNNRRNSSGQWEYLAGHDADVLFLQEVHHIPGEVLEVYSCVSSPTVSVNGNSVARQSVVLVRGAIEDELVFSSRNHSWVGDVLSGVAGSYVGVKARLFDKSYNLVCVYNPYWPLGDRIDKGVDVSDVKLQLGKGIWASDLFLDCLSSGAMDNGLPWIIGGDFNLCETLDVPQPRGNREFLDRMNDAGFYECLRGLNSGELVPTYGFVDGAGVNQLDYLYVSKDLQPKISSCKAGDIEEIFGGKLSDHLPIIGEIDV